MTLFFLITNLKNRLLVEVESLSLQLSCECNVVFVNVNLCVDSIVYEVIFQQKVLVCGRSQVFFDVHEKILSKDKKPYLLKQFSNKFI